MSRVDPVKRREYQNRYYNKNKHRPEFHAARYASSKKYALANPEKKRESRKKTTQLHRLMCLEWYSEGKMECACCGESILRFLTLDHINGGGAAHRRRVVGKALCFFTWLIKNDFCEPMRVLCYNCNIGRAHNGGLCPHQELGVSNL